MTFYFAMTNSWSLLYDEIYGDETMTDDIRITSLESDEYDPKPKSDKEDSDWKDPVITVGSGNTASLGDFVNFDISDSINNVTIDTSNFLSSDFTFNVDDSVVYAGDCIGDSGDSVYADTWPHAESLNIKMPDDYPSAFTTLSDNDDAIAHHVTTPGIEKDCTRKYKEDESIEALKNYISTTYGGHYSCDNNNVQTLDLIESVGDAESFCRSNAIKYLSRYDKKGQAKRDILKALHYSLLLYHFSGQLNETPTRGYETF